MELCRGFCMTFYCPYFWTAHKHKTFYSLRLDYNNMHRKVFDFKPLTCDSKMFVLNNNSKFEALMRKSILSLLETLFGRCGQKSCTSNSRLFLFMYFTIFVTFFFVFLHYLLCNTRTIVFLSRYVQF